MRAIIGAIVLTAAMATPAMAEPIYLQCSMDDGTGKQVPWTISADEATGKFNFTHSQGTYEERAIFTSTEIVVPDDGSSRYSTTVKRISRVDGKFTIDSTLGGERTIRQGQCKKAAAPARAF